MGSSGGLCSQLKIFAGLKNDNDSKKELAFTLGKAHEDILDYKKAFKYYNEGNNLRRNKINFSIIDEKKEFYKIDTKYKEFY